jgi:hypothetical protein
MNSASEPTGSDGGTASTVGEFAISVIGSRSLCGSNASFLYSEGFAARPMLAISSVYPSGLERTAARVPRLVLAPGRLSTTNGWPRRLLSPSLISRASNSDPPPAANGTMISTGRVG